MNGNCKLKLKRLLSYENETYYWMGFLLADASFGDVCMSLEISSRDRNHIEAFRDYLGIENIISERAAKRGMHGMCCLSLTDAVNLNEIKERFDINQRKTINPPNFKVICNHMSDDQFLCFIAGLCDGDGCVRVTTNGRTHLALEMHGSWLTNLEYIEDRVYDIIGVERFRSGKRLAKTNSRGHSRLVFSDAYILKNLRLKVETYKIPVMKRKWEKISMNETQTERMENNVIAIKIGLEQKFSLSEISRGIGMTVSSLKYIIKSRNLA